MLWHTIDWLVLRVTMANRPIHIAILALCRLEGVYVTCEAVSTLLCRHTMARHDPVNK